ncbi:ABC transporter substrate-binding protein [Lachnospiraceae bacterium C1.1]|nr:ABC transporter substrate-binding protein [Lachnospiraceae bacterium C1.1]
MRVFKKAVSVITASALAMSMLAGCGSSGSAASSGSEAAGSEAAGSEAASSEAVFKIGGIGPTTGGGAAYGTAVMNAIQLAVDEINEAGGVNGTKFECKFEDDELNAEKSVNAYNTLKDWGMQFLVGSVTSACSIAVSEKTKEDNLFQLSPSGSADDCVKYENVFRVCFSDSNQGLKSADYIADNKLGEKIGIIYDSSDVYSSGIYQKFAAEAQVKGLEIVSAEAFNADNKTDFSVQIQKAKDAGADLVFLPIYYTEAALILKQASTMDYAPKFFGCDGLDGITAVENFDASLAEGVMLLTPFAADATDDLTVNFVTKYKEAYTDTPNQFAADAYDAVYAVKAAIEKEGITADMSVSDICEKMKTGMTEISVEGLTGTITWDASGEPNKEPKGVIIENGSYVSMD